MSPHCICCLEPGTWWRTDRLRDPVPLCEAHAERWRTLFFYTDIRPDVPVAGLRSLPPPLAQPFHQSAEAAGTQAEAG
jgi:hypothetical protein